MGPAATLDFLVRLHAATPAQGDADHLRVITDSDPRVPGRNAALSGDGPSPGPPLAAMARGLVTAGAELLAMPCNAAHGWANEIVAATPVPFVSMIDAAVAAVLASGARTVGVLAADATLRSGLYRNALTAHGIAVIDVASADFMPVLARIKGGDTGPAVRAAMAALAAGLVAQGADAVLAACTEVPLVLSPADVAVPLIDATGALVDAVLAAALA
ncbi:amino acid racemase [Glacieibacterium frigidum]|uniref:Amino acid racemase n=2 Tax=Glacieibacterium frigidum TaxID=2593303 RepID=A0A552UJD2_9SPHN|nr:amino acid racemase [Glacieibacterium frigidum]